MTIEPEREPADFGKGDILAIGALFLPVIVMSVSMPVVFVPAIICGNLPLPLALVSLIWFIGAIIAIWLIHTGREELSKTERHIFMCAAWCLGPLLLAVAWSCNEHAKLRAQKHIVCY